MSLKICNFANISRIIDCRIFGGLLPVHRTYRPLLCNIHTKTRRFFSTSYHDIEREATSLESKLDSNEVVQVLKNFISSNYNSNALKQIFNKTEPSSVEELNINSYLVVLQLCSRLKIKELDLMAPLSVNLGNLLSKFFKQSDKEKNLEHKEVCLNICRIYNDLKIFYDPLFLTISERFADDLEAFTTEELALLLSGYSIQRYNEPEIVKNISEKIENGELKDLEPKLAVSFYSSLANLEYLTPSIKSRLEDVFMEKGDKFYKFNEGLNHESLLSVAYSNLLLDCPTINDLEIVLSCLLRISELGEPTEKLTTGFLRNFTVTVSYIKCLHRELYDLLDDEAKRKIMNLVLQYNESKKFEMTVFTQKVSEHLKRMRIRLETNTYKNGVLLDIVEQDQNLVWLCNSYHRFYATTFNMTANSKLLTKLIKAFGYKVASINYYQWGRMKCKRTRFAFLRMARYYALKDKREYDPKYSGWSLPYIWWNYTARDRLHISHYDHYNP